MVGTQTEVTKDQVVALLKSKPMAVVRAIEAIYAYQTADEQSDGETKHHNGVGFNGTDAEILSSFARQIADWRASKEVGTPKYAMPLSFKQMQLARYKLFKYAGQLARIANQKIEDEIRAEREAIQGVEYPSEVSDEQRDEYLAELDSEYYDSES